MPNGLDIGSLAGRIELDDQLTPTLDLSQVSVKQFEEAFGHLGGTVTENAASFGLAELAVKGLENAVHLGVETIKDLTTEGAAIGDVEDNFDRLATQAGRLGANLIGSLREGTHDTITNFELMKTVNADLAAGMNLTDQQFNTLAKGAFALAQATGGDVKSALDSMNDAMLTGRTRTIALLTGKIDLTAAEQDFADSLGVSVDHLSEEGKLQAARLAILDSVGKATERIGEQTDGLDEMIAQAQTAWKNWYEELARTIATSPNVVRAFVSIRDALVQAFGGDSQHIMESVVGFVNRVADAVTTYGPVVIDWFVTAKTWVVDLYHQVVDSWNALPDWLKTVAERSALTVAGLVVLNSTASAVGGGLTDLIGTAGNLTTTFSGLPTALGNVTKFFGEMKNLVTVLDFTSLANARASIALIGEAALGAIGPLGLLGLTAASIFAAWEVGKTRPVSDFFEKLGLEVQGFSAAEAEAAVQSRHLNEEFMAQQKHSFEQKNALNEAADAARQKAAADRAAAEESAHAAQVEERNKFIIAQTAEEIKKKNAALEELRSSGESWRATVAAMDEEMVRNVKTYLEAGVSQQALATAYNLTATQVHAVAEALKEEQANFKLEQKQLADSTERWAQYHAMVQERSGTATDRLIADIERWKAEQIRSHVEAKTDTSDFYDWLSATEHESYRQSEQQRLEADVHSKAHYQAVAADARDAYEFALQHANEFTDGYIEDLRRASEAAAQAAANWESNLGGALDAVTDKVRTLSGEFISLQEQQARQSQGFTADLPVIDQFTIDRTPGGADALLKKLFDLQNILGTEKDSIRDIDSYLRYQSDLAMFQSLRNAYSLLKSQAKGTYGALPGFEEGGIGDFGDGTLAMLHGKEAIVPLGQGAGALAPVNITQYINGTATDVARQVSNEIMRVLKQGRQFGAA